MSRHTATRDEIGDLQWLLTEIDRLPVSAQTKAEFRRLLRTLEGRRIYISRRLLSHPMDVAQAISLLTTGCSVAQTREALMERSNVSRDKAYRLIRAALDKRGRAP